jgi:hypothetical protein
MKCKTYLIAIFILIVLVGGLVAKEKEAIEIPLIDTPPQIDGKLDEAVWSTAARFQGFISWEPDYGKPASEKTVMYLCSDRENFYFAARCFQKNPSEIKGTVTHRDNMYGDDYAAICIDTFHDMQSSYVFLVNPLGIQGDGIFGAEGNLDSSHDMVWFSKGVIDDKGYTIEVRIPFKSIRFPVKKQVKMGIWMARNIVRTSENVCYPEIFPDKGAILSQAQPILVRDMKYKRIVELLPAFTHSRAQSIDQGQWGAEDRQTDFSLTGKLGITPSLMLDATYNPDFSQVEADAGQVDVNLRYALYYQEKRPFFLEGMEEFKFAGNTEDAPLYAIVHTRTIIDPLLGFKLTGKINRKNSISTIFAIDEPLDPLSEIPSESNRSVFGILRFRHVLKKDAYFGGFYTGREMSDGYNRAAGIDGRFRVSNSAVAEYHLLGSLTKAPETDNTILGHALGLRYLFSNRRVILDAGVQDISQDFQVDTGFLTRRGLTRFALLGMYRTFPKSKFFQRFDTFYWSYHILDKESSLFETTNLFTFRVHMPGTSMFRIDLVLANEVFAGKRFDTSSIGFRVESQLTKHLYVYAFYRYGGSIFYDPDNPFPGKSNQVSLTLQYQPVEKLNTSLDLTYSDFYRKSDSQKEYDYTILRSKTTFQLNKYLFFRGIAEYNFFREELFLDFLASFTYIPGTVVHIGYGSVLEKIHWDSNLREYVPAQQFEQTHRAFFFKVSYLWRL